MHQLSASIFAQALLPHGHSVHNEILVKCHVNKLRIADFGLSKMLRMPRKSNPVKLHCCEMPTDERQFRAAV